MDKKTAISKSQLHSFFQEFIDRVRLEYERLNDNEKACISWTFDYRIPCQIEVFWLSEPVEYQYIIISHFENRPDKEILINGPYKGNEFTLNISKILDEPRWREPISEKSRFFRDSTKNFRMSDLLIIPYRNLLNEIQNYAFYNRRDGIVFGGLWYDNSWVYAVKGNIVNLDTIALITENINEIKSRALLDNPHFQRVSSQLEAVSDTKGFGGYFYPFIWIGDIPDRTFEQKITNDYYPQQKIIDFSSGKISLLGYTDGLIIVITDEKAEALAVLNTIFSVCTISNLPCLSLKYSDIIEVEIDLNGNFRKKSALNTSYRSQKLFGDVIEFRVNVEFQNRKVSKEFIVDIFKKSAMIVNDENLKNLFNFYLEGVSFFDSAEYSQSFIALWLIVEKHISDLWHDFLCELKIYGKRKKKLKQHLFWTTDYIIEVLNFNKVIDNTFYVELMKLKKCRNDFIHNRKPLNKLDSEKLLKICEKIIQNYLNDLESQPLR